MQGYSVLSMDMDIVLFKSPLDAEVWRTVRLVCSVSVIVQLNTIEFKAN